MLIEKLDGSISGDHQQLFPQTGFPEDGPSDAWLDKHGFRRLSKTSEELAAEIRDSRNRLLSDTDWRFRSDLTPSQAWIDYCQELRDITEQSGFPHTVLWPTKPQ